MKYSVELNKDVRFGKITIPKKTFIRNSIVLIKNVKGQATLFFSFDYKDEWVTVEGKNVKVVK